MPKMTNDEIAELIQRRRLQVLIHSCIYYEFNESIIPDAKWSEWALELEQLQAKYPKIAKKVIYAEEFEGFDHSTGCDLPTRNSEVTRKARWLIDYVRRNKLLRI